VSTFEDETPVALTAAFIKCEPSEEQLAACRTGETEERVAVTVECERFHSNAGFFSTKSAKEIVNDVARYEGCHTLGMSCANFRAENPENHVKTEYIFTDQLRGILGYVKKTAPKEIGIDWKPESGHEVAKFSCGGNMTIVLGGAQAKEGPVYSPSGGGSGMIAVVTPINEMVPSITQVLSANEETTENIPSKFEGKPLQALEGYFLNPDNFEHGSKWSPMAESAIWQSTFNQAGAPGFPEEIKG
jgi:hypothetical protein